MGRYRQKFEILIEKIQGSEIKYEGQEELYDSIESVLNKLKDYKVENHRNFPRHSNNNN